jgi:outer membrane protein assembly factor BamA
MSRVAATFALACLLVAPGAAAQAPPPEVLGEVRIHGNHTTPDDLVLGIAGLTVGQPIDDAAIEAARQRLKKSGRFEDVQIRKRYRSLEPGAPVALVVIVQEHPLPDPTTPGAAAPGPVRKLLSSGMFMPVLRYADGYGFTYGARFAFVDTFGHGGRISIPLTWGGTRRAAVELETPVARGPIDRLAWGGSVSGQTNPFYELDENREDVWFEGSRRFARHFRAAGHADFGHVTFGVIDENVWTYGVDLSVDTRTDPIFPRNAVFASAGWERLDPTREPAANRLRAEVRGYRGLVGQSVLSVRVQYAGADGPLPDYARPLLGGATTLRGWRPGSFSGDNLLSATAELRVPITSAMHIAKLGLNAFADVGTAWDHGQALGDSKFHPGAGAGAFLLASLFQLNLDVGFRPGWGTRIHFSTGLQF